MGKASLEMWRPSGGNGFGSRYWDVGKDADATLNEVVDQVSVRFIEIHVEQIRRYRAFVGHVEEDVIVGNGLFDKMDHQRVGTRFLKSAFDQQAADALDERQLFVRCEGGKLDVNRLA